jgi:hypothetical protein
LRYFSEGGFVTEDPRGYPDFTGTAVRSGLCVAAKVKNYGRAPARLNWALLRVSIVNPETSREEPIFKEQRRINFNSMLGDKDASEEIKLGPMHEAARFMGEIEAGTKYLLLVVSVNYEDVFENTKSGGALFYWDPKSQSFVHGSPYGIKQIEGKR